MTHVLPATDYTFFKKPSPIKVPTPPQGWKSPSATSTPLSKATLKPSLDDLDTSEPLVDLTEVGDDHDDEDEMSTPWWMESSKSRGTHRSSRGWGSPPAKKAWTESPTTHKTSRPKSRKTSHASRDEQEECEHSSKELEYKKM